MNNKRKNIVFKLSLTIIMIIALTLGLIKNNSATEIKKIESMGVMYDSHIQSIGWEKQYSKKDGETSGTSGQSLRLEALNIKLYGEDENVGIRYKTHIQSIGWQNWKENDEMSGTEGQSLRLEAVKIELENTEKYSVMYRVHVQNEGWQEWKVDGETAGTEGKSQRLEAIEIKIIKKSNENVHVQYSAHVQSIGWQQYCKDGQTAGTVKENKRLEAIKIEGINLPTDAKIKYQTHISTIGWQEYKRDGELSGTQGQSKSVEALKIELENTDEYSIKYRANISGLGWQEWKYDGEIAGTTGRSLKLEAIEIEIVKKEKRGLIHIDTPANDKTYYLKEMIKVSGWRMTNVSNTILRAFIDEDEIEQGTISQVKRQDILENILGYGTEKENPTPGFEFNINTDCLDSGKHKIKIFMYLNEDVIQQDEITINIDKDMHIEYSTHVQSVGWQRNFKDGEMAGTTGECKRIEAIKIRGLNLPKEIKIKYQVYIEELRWQDWKNANEIAGTIGESKRIEAIKILLDKNDKYSIMYRMFVQNIGWQDWCYDGECAGTQGVSQRIEALEIKLVPKIKNSKFMSNIDVPSGEVANEQSKINGWCMSTLKNTEYKILIDENEIDTSELQKTRRQDVLNYCKGYGDNNENPGFEMNINYAKYSLGNHKIKFQCYSEEGQLLTEVERDFTIRKKINYSKGAYGITGLKAIGDNRGSYLEYYKYGDGPNVFYATFAIHGFEDLWDKDGKELVQMANDFYNGLIDNNNYDLAEKWTIYIFPGVNQDGLNYGYTNGGPGRTTLYSQAPNNKGIDLNRCWQIGSTYQRYGDNRNYNGTSGFQAYESQYLRDFLLNHRSKNGQTVLVDLHGWTQQLIGDSGICSFYEREFSENDKSAVGRYGTGYLINWARNSLGSSQKVARAALIELPNSGVYGHQSVLDKNFSNRYINATLSMLMNI